MLPILTRLCAQMCHNLVGRGDAFGAAEASHADRTTDCRSFGTSYGVSGIRRPGLRIQVHFCRADELSLVYLNGDAPDPTVATCQWFASDDFEGLAGLVHQ